MGAHGAAGVAVRQAGRRGKCAGKGTREHVGTPSLDAPGRQHKVIAAIRGSVIARGTDHVVVEVNGVGYKVFVPRHPSRDEVLLHTHQVVREDAQALYGFETREELALFDLLIGVSGVGPKAGMAILSVARPAEIASAIASGDAAALARAPGVGKKTAERLIVDLRGKIGRVAGEPASGGPLPTDDDAHAALVALGYTASEASAALQGVPPRERASPEERIGAALRAAGRPRVAAG
ncbi:MAG: Holliday junction branch migration protein RuvA [Chloroflexi bacterium]|nr:MAG: Holliday junction branch migration protein RuvA [Chloroflexota bacterium]